MILLNAIGGTAVLVAASVVASALVRQEPVAPHPPAQSLSLFEWFDTLDYDAVRSGRFVRVDTRYEWGDEVRTGEPLYGFLLGGSDQEFSVLTLDLDTLRFPSSWPERKASFVAADIGEWAQTELKPKRSDPLRHIGWEGPLTLRGFLFVAARACDARGLKALSEEFLKRSKAEHDQYRRENPDYRIQLEVDLATHAVWEAIGRFGDPRVSRKELLARLERIVRDFPGGPREDVAKETIALLQHMVAEDEVHPAPPSPLAQLPMEQQVSELIFQLRDQPGFQSSVPGYPDVLETPEATPANQLLRLGFAAVPQLLDTLKDERYTRAMQMIRFTGYSRPIRVKDATRTILSAIAVRSFWPEGAASTVAEWDQRVEDSARQWWREIQKKGEQRTLIEGVERGDYEGGQQAKVLAEKYPMSAVAAIKVALSRATEENVRTPLVAALMPVRSSEALVLAKHHMLAGTTLPERLAGARVVSSTEAPVAVQAMISEWKSAALGNEWELFELIAFLAGSGSAKAIEALGAELSAKDPETRRGVVGAFHSPIPFVYPDGFPQEGQQPSSAQEKEEYRSAVEALLVGELTDTADGSGAILNYGGESFAEPRLCDLAASQMAMLWPSRYHYRVTSSLQARDALRFEALNTWRVLKGLTPLPLPAKPSAKAPTERQSLLVSQALASTGPERDQAIEQLLPGAASVLPLVLQEIERRTESKLDSTDVQRIAATLACAVRELQVRGPGGPLTTVVKELRGKALTTEWVRELVRKVQQSWPAEARSVEFHAYRDEDGRGFAVKVVFSDERDGMNPTMWSYSHSVCVGTKSLDDSAGSGTPGPAMDERALTEFASAVHEALRSPPLNTISIRLSLARPK